MTTDECTSDDACSSSQQCEVAGGRCVGLAFCAADRTCPIGTLGALCNSDDEERPFVAARTAGKCLIGYCRGDEHCPAPLKCLDIGVVNEGVGRCK